MNKLKKIRKLAALITGIGIVVFVLSMDNSVVNTIKGLWIKNVYLKDYFQTPRELWERNFLVNIVRNIWPLITKVAIFIYVFLVLFSKRLLKPLNPKAKWYSYSRIYACFVRTLDKIPESKKDKLLYVVSCHGDKPDYSALFNITKLKRVSLGNKIINKWGCAIDKTKLGLRELNIEMNNDVVCVCVGEKKKKVQAGNCINIYTNNVGNLSFDRKDSLNKLLTISVL